MSEREMETFLDSRKSDIRRSYERGLKLFSQFYGKPIKQILEERKDDVTPRPNENFVDGKNRAKRFEDILEKYWKWLQKPQFTIMGKPNKGYGLNTAHVYCVGVLQLFRYYSMGITLRAGSPISQTVVSLGNFVLRAEHIKKMFHVAKDLRSKLIISMANDLGWRIGDFLSIKVGELPDLELEPPLEFNKITEKRKIVAMTCLSRDTVELLKEYIFTFGLKDDSYLFWSNGGHVAETTITARIRDLARDAEINLHGKKLIFHCFRKMIISEAKNLQIDPDIINVMVGKNVKKDILTYMTGVNIRKAFIKLQTVTHINGGILSKKKEEIFEVLKTDMEKTKKTMLGLERENSTLKTRIDLLQGVLKDLTKYILEELKAELPAKLKLQQTSMKNAKVFPFTVKSEAEKRLRKFIETS